MTTTTKFGLRAALCAAIFTAAPAATAAQATVTSETAEIEALRDRAEASADSRDGFLEASILFRRAADMQGDRPEAVDDLIKAARLAWYAGREGSAIDDLDRAAATALEWGDVMTAASAWLDAAWVAWQDGDTEEAYGYATRAERLSHSPLIQRQERAAIRARITDFDS